MLNSILTAILTNAFFDQKVGKQVQIKHLIAKLGLNKTSENFLVS